MRIGKAEKGIERKMGEVDKESVALARQQAETVSQGTRSDLAQEGDAEPRGNATKLMDRNNRSHVLRRLARERPDLLDQVEAGHLTANAAAIEAGFRTRKVQVELTPEANQRLLNRRMPKWRLVNTQTGEAFDVEER
jgi:hypothetical protein